MHDWETEDFADLVRMLKAGLMGKTGEKWSDERIDRENMSVKFKERFEVCLRKKIHPPALIRHKLELWFKDFAHEEDPFTGKKLFTVDTKTAVDEQRKNAENVTDTVPVEELHRIITKGPKSRTKHSLLKKKSLRCESHLESFHLKLKHFANTNSSQALADHLNLIGTCRHNVTMRHRLWWNSLPMEERVGVIQFFAQEPMHYNHSVLAVVNQWAVSAGCDRVPFPEARPLPEHTGEVFFGKALAQAKERVKAKCRNHEKTRRCMCPMCGGNPGELTVAAPPAENEASAGESTIVPQGTRFADKPSTRKRKAPPQMVPSELPKAPPLRIAPQPPSLPLAPQLPHVMAPPTQLELCQWHQFQQMQQMQQLQPLHCQQQLWQQQQQNGRHNTQGTFDLSGARCDPGDDCDRRAQSE